MNPPSLLMVVLQHEEEEEGEVEETIAYLQGFPERALPLHPFFLPCPVEVSRCHPSVHDAPPLAGAAGAHQILSGTAT